MMTPEFKSLLTLLEKWFAYAMADVFSIPPIRGDGMLMLGGSVWGEKYLDRLQSYTLPSIVATRNFQALRGRCHLVLFTDMASSARLIGLCRQLETGGITTQIKIIPHEIMVESAKDPLGKYWQIGVAGNVLMQMGGRTGMGLHSFYPDHLYADGYFENLLRLAKDHQAIVQPGISADIETAWKDIEPYRNEDGNLAIPDRALGTIGWKHLHKQTKASLMNRATIPTNMPHSHFLVWQGHDKIVMHCCHMNGAYLAPELLAKAKTRIPATLDTELPTFVPDGQFYVPTIEDGMAYLELSDGDKGVVDKFVDFPTFSERCWTHVRFLDDWMPYFERPYAVPMDRQPHGLTDEEIADQFGDVHAMLMDDKARAAIAFIPKLAYKG